MTRKSRRLTRRRSARAAADREQQGWNRDIAIVLIVGFAALAGYFMLTGNDPFGLFTDAQPTATPGPGLTGSGGDWWQVYFTNPQNVGDATNLAGSVLGELVDHIDEAQSTIHIATYEFDLPPVADALIAAHQRGVQVQWVTDDEHGIEADEEEEIGLFARLERAGVGVKDDGRGALMHNKFWIFDSRTVWTGSINVTVNGNFRNNNNAIVIESPQVATMYEREFAEMWDGEFGPTSPSTVDQQRVTIDGTPVQVLFAPEDEVASWLLPLIEGAQSRVRFMAFSFTHDELAAAVLARARAGVDVQGIFETRGSETEFSALPTLYCAGVSVRKDGNPGTFHHKVFVIDDRIVVTGSYNFSASADERNDENLVILTNRDVAAQYGNEFDRRWAEARQPDPARLNCP